MNKQLVSMVVALGLGVGTGLYAVTGELLSQLSLQRGVIHYPLEGCDPEKPWQIDAWAAGYGRSACSAFMCDGCNDDKSTGSTVDLSKLFFGKTTFKGQEAFAGGVLTQPSGIPGLSFSTISPQFSYSEAGAFVGIHAQKDICDSCWVTGVRASLPISKIQVKQRSSCACEDATDDGEQCKLVVRRQEFTNAQDGSTGSGPKMNNVYAYRLDFLSTLKWLDGSPLVKYGDGATDTMIAYMPITLYADRGQTENVEAAVAPMYLLRAEDGELSNAIEIGTPDSVREINNLGRNVGPETPSDPAQLAAWTLNSAGTNGINGERKAFGRFVNYNSALAHDPAQQKQWFLVPNSTGAAGEAILIEDANAVQNAIDYILHRAECTSALGFFKEHGVDFNASDCVAGAGDLYAEWYTGYHPDCWYIDMLLGTKLPTGKKMCDAKRIYWQPTGNNGHFEFRAGFEGGCRRNWFAVRGMASYTYAFDHTQMRAPAFVGAKVRNISAGESVPARVHWGYFWGNIDFTLFHPQCCDCGLVLGYELYAKQSDKVCFCNSTAKDFLGFTHQLDERILEEGTNTRLHKIRGEFFHRVGCCEYFGGAYYSLAGSNALKETEFHVGAAIYF